MTTPPKTLIVLFILGIAGVIFLGVILPRSHQDRSQPASEIAATPGNSRTAAFPEIGSRAEDFVLQDLDGRTIRLSDFRGKGVFLNFWASWCPFCLHEMPAMAALQKEFPEALAIVAINRGEPAATARRFAQEVGVLGVYTLLLDPDDATFKTYQGFAMPTTYFLDAEGMIRDRKLGPLDLAEMRERVETILPKR